MYAVIGSSLFAAIGSAQTMPVFPDDWSSDEKFNTVQQQSAVVDPDLGFCCATSSNCQVQVQSDAGTRYFSYSTKHARFDSTEGNGITIYDYPKQKEVFVDENLVCTSYCPMIGAMQPFAMLYDGAVDLGTETILGHTVQHWQYKDIGPLKIVMETDNSYIDQTDATSSVPVLEMDHITPFGIHLADVNESWTNWKAGAQDASLFAWTEDSSAGCPKNGNCGNMAAMQRRLQNREYAQYLLLAQDNGMLPSYIDLTALKQAIMDGKSQAEAIAAMEEANQGWEKNLGATRGVMDRPATSTIPAMENTAVPSFPQDFFADTADFLILPQGDYTIESAGDITYWCCGLQSNCAVQTEYQFGPMYTSLSTNQTRFGGGAGQPAVVTDYNLGLEMAVDVNNTCTAYCPLNGQTMFPIIIDDDAKDLGKVNIGGNGYEHFMWIDTAGKWQITVDQIDAFVDLTDVNNPVPFIWAEILEPLKHYIASVNTTYTNFVGGRQDPSLFAVNGIQACPKSNNCGSSSSTY
jgi:hypothetical protein